MDVDDPSLSTLPEDMKDAEVMKYMRELLELYENKSGIWTQDDVWKVCRSIDLEYTDLNRVATLLNAPNAEAQLKNLQYYRLQLPFFFMFLRNGVNMGVCPPDAVAWAFGKLLSVKTMLSVDLILGDLIQEQLLPIAQLLDDRMAFSLIVDLTLTLADLMACNERFASDSQPIDVTVLKSVLTVRKELRHSETGASVVIRPVPLKIISLDSCENLQVCITYFLLHGHMSLKFITPANRQRLWITLLKQLELDSLKVTLRLALQLVAQDLCSSVMALLLVDHMLALCEWLLNRPPCEEPDVDADFEGMEEALNSCLRECGRKLADCSKSQVFAGVTMPKLAEWGGRCVRLLERQSVAGRPRGLLDFVTGWASVMALVCGAAPDACRPLAGSLLAFVRRTLAAGHPFSVAQLADLFNFFIRLDKLDSSSSITNEMKEMAQEYQQQFSAVANVSGALERYTLLLGALAQTKSASYFVPSMVPDTLHLMTALRTIALNPSQGVTALTNLVLLVDNLVSSKDLTAASRREADWLALLSVPWLANYSGNVQRYTSSLDLLVQVHTVARQISSFCNSQVKLVTLTAIASLQIGNEWRRTLFQLALNSSDAKIVVAAVENVAIFVRSIKKVDASISLVCESILPLISLRAGDNRLRGAVLRCMGKTMCALSGQSTVAVGLAGMEIHCALCSAASVDPPHQPRQVRAAVPEAFYEVLMSVVSNPTAEKEHRLEGCAVLQAMLKHADRGTPALEQRFDQLIVAALRLFVDPDPDVRESFCACLPDIVKLSMSETANLDMQNIMFTLHNDNPDDCAWLARYLRIIISNANDAKLAEICFVKLVLLASVTPATMEEAKASVFEEINKDANCSMTKINKDAPNYSAKKGLFVRRSNVICRYLVEELCVEMKLILSEGQKDRSTPSNIIMSRFNCLAELFDFQSSLGEPDALAWLSDACKDLVPWLVMKMSKEASAVLQCIANKMGTNRYYLLLDSFPFILLKVMQQARSEQQINAIFSFVVDEGGAGRSGDDKWAIERYMVWNSHFCTVQLVLHLSENEHRFLLVLRKLHMLCERLTIDQDAQAADALSLSDCLRDRYLGILLNFRLAFTENGPTPEKKIMLNSLCRVIQLIDRDMVDEARLKILLVLRVAADWLPAEVAGVWLVFAQVLPDASLASLLPQLLVGVWSLLNQTAIDPLLEHVFVHRLERLRLAASRTTAVDQPTNPRTDSPKILTNPIDQLCIVAAESPGSTRLDPYLPREALASSTETILQACLHLVQEEQSEVKQFALLKLDDTLRKRTDDVHALTVGSDNQLNSTVAALIVALMDCLRNCEQLAARSLAARCLGELGAIDPGRLGLELSAPSQPGKAPVDRRAQVITFIDDGDDFFVALLTRAAKVFVAVSDAKLHEQCSLSIQTILRTLECAADCGGGRELWERLDASSRRNMSPLLTSNYRKMTSSAKVGYGDGPIIDNDRETTFSEWLSAWVQASASKVEDPTLNRLFRAVDGLTDGDTGFARFVVPQIILQGLLENNIELIEETKKEIVAVLLKTCAMGTSEDSWMRMAAQVVFAILDCLYQWTLVRREKVRNGQSLDSQQLSRVENFIKEIAMTWAHDPSKLSASEMSATDPNRLLLVAAAEGCQSTARALLWYEQYAIDPSQPIDQHMHTMQRLYAELDETDGVIGALAVARKAREPTAEEYILAYEATGDYTEALPFYRSAAADHLSSDNDMGLMKCLLLLNQPQLVLSCVDEALKQRLEFNNERDTREMMDKLNSYRIEATWRLQRWEDLDSLLSSESKSWAVSSWGATVGELMAIVNKKEAPSFHKKLALAREKLISPLTATVMETAGAYPQAYKYICQLHNLAEIEDAAARLGLLIKGGLSSQTELELQSESMMERWDGRCKLMMQSSRSLEPLLTVRRQLLRFAATEQVDQHSRICRFWLHSAKIARNAHHLQTAWGFIVKAKELSPMSLDVIVEEARFNWKKGNQTEAIGLLSKGIRHHFPDMVEFRSSQATVGGHSAVLQTEDIDYFPDRSPAEKFAFVKAQILLAEYMHGAGASNISDLYVIYVNMFKLSVPSEHIYYKIALFIDEHIYQQRRGAEIVFELTRHVINAYLAVLKHGSAYLHHAMPRMLTIWLNFCQKRHGVTQEQSSADKLSQAATIVQTHKVDEEVAEINLIIQHAFDAQVPHFHFYSAFSLLISRITHPIDSVFDTLKEIMATLLVEHPQQCLWQSVAVYRSDRKSLRHQRCNSIYARAVQMQPAANKGSSRDLSTLISHFAFLAAVMIKIAEDKSGIPKSHTEAPQVVHKLYPFLSGYFNDKVFDLKIFNDELGTQHTPNNLPLRGKPWPKILLPLQAMLDASSQWSSSTAHAESLTQPAVGCVDRANPIDSINMIYIDKLDDDIMIMRSVQRPKRITLLGSDGRRYPIMCKPSDELRKDQRVMEVNRVVNAILRQDPEARRRQLFVRTYSVIPLQAAGGLIEWVPNLQPYRYALSPLVEEKAPPLMTDKEWFGNKPATDAPIDHKLHVFRSIFLARHPMVMSEWFRRTFADPCGWYAARLAFTHTAAVMSMVGFLLGLGDRHGENILLDITCGDVIHVDFNLLFNKSEELSVPEVVPFRLTRNMVDGLGPFGVEGPFRRSCESTLRVLRDKKMMLLTVLQSFVHDPLVEWIATEQRNQQLRQTRSNARKSVVAAPQRAVDFGAMKSGQAISLIDMRLSGKIVTYKVHKETAVPSLVMSVEGQVNELINLATSERNLARMYIGWCAFL